MLNYIYLCNYNEYTAICSVFNGSLRSNIWFCSGHTASFVLGFSCGRQQASFLLFHVQIPPPRGPPPVRCQQNNRKLTVVRNDTGAAIDQQSGIISWTEERQTDSVFQEEREEHRVVAQCRQAADVTGLGCCIYLVFIKAEDEIRELQEASVFKLCVSVCVWPCVCVYVCVSYCVAILATMIAITTEKGDIRPRSSRGALLSWSDLDWEVRLWHTHKISFWHPSNEKRDNTGGVHKK